MALQQGETLAQARTRRSIQALKYKNQTPSGLPAVAIGGDAEIQLDGSVLYTATALDTDGKATNMPPGTPQLSDIVVDGKRWAVTHDPKDVRGWTLVGRLIAVPGPEATPVSGLSVKAEITFPATKTNAEPTPLTVDFPNIDIIDEAALEEAKVEPPPKAPRLVAVVSGEEAA